MTFSENASYISLKRAAWLYGLSENMLLDKVNSGALNAVELKTGEILVANNELDPSLTIRREDFDHLRGVAVSTSEASQRYEIDRSAFNRWVRSGFITVLNSSRSMRLLDEADVAYCAAVYQAKVRIYDGQITGVRIFDRDGNPYQAKYPEMAAHKRDVRKRQRQRRNKNQD